MEIEKGFNTNVKKYMTINALKSIPIVVNVLCILLFLLAILLFTTSFFLKVIFTLSIFILIGIFIYVFKLKKEFFKNKYFVQLKIQSEQKNLEQLGQLKAHLFNLSLEKETEAFASQSSEQFYQVDKIINKLHETLLTKLNPDEITYLRYLKASELAHQNLISQFEKIISLLNLEKLSSTQMYKENIESLISSNKKIIVSLQNLLNSVSNMTNLNQHNNNMKVEDISNELKTLAERANLYKNKP